VSAVLHYVTDAASALEQARQRGAHAYLVGPVTSKEQALDAIGNALSFPSWYGHNLDALYDCLVDLSWQPAGEQVLIWAGHRKLAGADPDAYRAVLEVLRDAAAARSDRPLTVVLADE
jgi:RNAse (barnase) inhibitor barstar